MVGGLRGDKLLLVVSIQGYSTVGDVFADKDARSAVWPVIVVRKWYSGEKVVLAVTEYICV